MTAWRVGVYFLGLVLVLLGVWLFLTQTGISAFIPMSLVLIALLLIVGVAVMRASHVGEHAVVEREVVDRPVHGGPVVRDDVPHRRRWWR